MKKEKIVVLETNIDDTNPQFLSYAIEKLIKAGAEDAFVKSILMKKGRFGFLLTVLCKERLKEKMAEIIFDETTAFGVRTEQGEHISLEKEIKKIKTKYGLVRVKIGRFKGKIKTISPEFEDCKKLAFKNKIPLKSVFEEVKKQV